MHTAPGEKRRAIYRAIYIAQVACLVYVHWLVDKIISIHWVWRYCQCRCVTHKWQSWKLSNRQRPGRRRRRTEDVVWVTADGMKSVAIIGAGASGLTAIKCCLEDGLQPTCFERTATLGGLWYYTDEVRPGQACTAKTTTANTSKEMLAFSDYPMPDEFPNYLHNTKVLEYLFMYAKHFDLEKHIHFQTDVVSLKPASDYDSTGRWVVETRSVETGLLASATFDAVLVGNGHHSVPNRPTIAGEDVFRGRVIHSFEYRDHRGYEDQTVVVVGLGNSGGDIAVDLSRIAKQVGVHAFFYFRPCPPPPPHTCSFPLLPPLLLPPSSSPPLLSYSSLLFLIPTPPYSSSREVQDIYSASRFYYTRACL